MKKSTTPIFIIKIPVECKTYSKKDSGQLTNNTIPYSVRHSKGSKSSAKTSNTHKPYKSGKKQEAKILFKQLNENYSYGEG